MARAFDDALSQFLYVASTPIVAAPFTLAAWGKCDVDDGYRTVLSIGDKDVTSDAWALRFEGEGTGDPIAFLSWDEPAFGKALTSTGYSTNTWHHLCGVETAANSRAVYLDGAGKGTDSTASSPDNADRTTIGIEAMINLAQPMSGDVAEVAVWDDALTDAEVAILAAGFSPLFVRPQNLVFYVPLVRDNDQDIVGGLSFTPDNSPTIAAHCPIIYPAPALFVPSPVAVVAGQPMMKRWGAIPHLQPGPAVSSRRHW